MLNRSLLLVSLCLLAMAAFPALAQQYEIIILDDPGDGLNDPTPVVPVGGNPGTTLGEQRLNLIGHAIEIWMARLEIFGPLQVQASMPSNVLPCDATSAVLGSAAPFLVRSFDGIPLPNTWYPSALANAIAGDDVANGNDINVQFNGDLDTEPICNEAFHGWYYGYDFNPSGQEQDLLFTLLHELGHGLGFSNSVSQSGSYNRGSPDVTVNMIRDLELGKNWDEMTNGERSRSIKNDPNLVWIGPNVTAATASVMNQPNLIPIVRVTAPAANATKARLYRLASFGTPLGPDITGELVLAEPNDGCGPITNNVAGKIVLIDRGDCEFGEKVLEAEQKGAVGVIIANQTDGEVLLNGEQITFMGPGDVGNQVTITSVMVAFRDGQTLRDRLGSTVTIGFDPDPAGTNGGYMRMHGIDPYARGSSVSHFSEEGRPELLMSPEEDPLEFPNDPLDLTVAFMQDIGWQTIEAEVGSKRLFYSWLSHNTDFESILVINNYGSVAATVTLRARKTSGDLIEETAQVPAYGFLESTMGDLFPSLPSGVGGITVELESTTLTLAGRWVTNSLQAASGASPSQGVAVDLSDTSEENRVGNALLFGYLPNKNGAISAPVIANTGTVNTDVNLFIFDENGNLLASNPATLTDLGSLFPVASTVGNLLGESGENVTMIAQTSDQPITGVTFVFDMEFSEPAIGNAQVIDFTPPVFKNKTVSKATPGSVELMYSWLSYNDLFQSTLVVNNFGSVPAQATLTARKETGDPFQTTIDVPAFGFMESNIGDLFAGLPLEGGGITVTLESAVDTLAGRWVTTSLQSDSMASPSQGVAVAYDADHLENSRVGNALLLGYLPDVNGAVSAPVITNTGNATTTVTLYFFDSNGGLIDTTTRELEPLRPWAETLDGLLPERDETVSMVATSADQNLTGVVFVFDGTFLEPAIGNAQAIEFTPPVQ